MPGLIRLYFVIIGTTGEKVPVVSKYFLCLQSAASKINIHNEAKNVKLIIFVSSIPISQDGRAGTS